MYGAKSVVFADLSDAAVANTEENVRNYVLSTRAKVVKSNLFENVVGVYNVIVFNHPFFSDHTIEELLISTAMLDRGKLIHRFLEDAKKYLVDGGIIIMPYFHAAGPVNDPSIQAPEHGYDVLEKMSIIANVGLQKGRVSIYELSLKSPKT